MKRIILHGGIPGFDGQRIIDPRTLGLPPASNAPEEVRVRVNCALAEVKIPGIAPLDGIAKLPPFNVQEFELVYVRVCDCGGEHDDEVYAFAGFDE
jgi:hypothetical protein